MDNNETLHPAWFLPQGAERRDKDRRTRLKTYLRWLTLSARQWFEPDLLAFLDYLLDGLKLSPATAKAHLTTVRARYRELLDDSTIYWELHNMLEGQGDASDVNRQIDILVAQIEQQIDPRRTPIKLSSQPVSSEPSTQDKPGLNISEIVHLFWLAQQREDRKGLVGTRDLALFALLLGFGLREYEACRLEAADLSLVVDGQLTLRVRPGYGCTERLIPYDSFAWMTKWIFSWLEAAHITSGPVIRGFLSRDHSVRPDGLSPRSVEKILQYYDRVREGGIRPMDLRRAHARLLFESNVSLPEIQARLGLKGGGAVLSHIGGDESRLGISPEEDPIDILRTKLEG